jgi:hypothetical protein
MSKTFPARLHGVLAREAPVAVIFRKGPSMSVASVLWDRSRDTFRLGQWFRGRIYERRADLSPDGECLSVYFVRLMRDGWTMREEPGQRLDYATVFDRPLAHGWVLRKIAHAQVGAAEGKSCYWDEHELRSESTGTVAKHPDWEWADVDGDSVVWASGGCLFRAAFDRATGVAEPKLLHDFNAMKFEAIAAPY